MIATGHPEVSVERRCKLLGLPRSSYYRGPSCQQKDHSDQAHDSNSPAVLLSIFNVINPRNVVLYHLAPV